MIRGLTASRTLDQYTSEHQNACVVIPLLNCATRDRAIIAQQEALDLPSFQKAYAHDILGMCTVFPRCEKCFAIVHRVLKMLSECERSFAIIYSSFRVESNSTAVYAANAQASRTSASAWNACWRNLKTWLHLSWRSSLRPWFHRGRVEMRSLRNIFDDAIITCELIDALQTDEKIQKNQENIDDFTQ